MNIKLNTFANIRDVIGAKEISIELSSGATLGDLFGFLKNKYGKPFERQIKDQITGEIVPFLILVNEKTYRSIADLEAPLYEGDSVTIMIPFDGG